MYNTPVKYSAVIPVHNEEGSVLPLYERLKTVLDGLGEPYEIIVVDDASTDESLAKLESIRPDSPGLVVLSLKIRSGQSSALQAGFDAARGEILITLDGDLQNDPEDIPKLLEKLKEGYDIVCGWRYDRKDAISKKIASLIANAVRRALFKETIHDVGCSLRVFKRSVLKEIFLSSEDHRFFTAFAAQQGFQIGEVEVRHHPRQHGKSKYGIWTRLIRGILDLIKVKLSKPDDHG
ncbi:MAG: glycosyltransferase family 2 protein [Candidatus Omnitrophota bacterium]